MKNICHRSQCCNV